MFTIHHFARTLRVDTVYYTHSYTHYTYICVK